METPIQNPKKLDKSAMISLSFELGYIIAIPLVVFAVLGKWADKQLNFSFPWLTLAGIILAITATTIWLTKKLKTYIK